MRNNYRPNRALLAIQLSKLVRTKKNWRDESKRRSWVRLVLLFYGLYIYSSSSSLFFLFEYRLLTPAGVESFSSRVDAECMC